MITLVPVNRIDAVWPLVREGLQQATMNTGGALTTGELWQGCRSGEIFMLTAHDDSSIQGVSLWRPEDWQTGRKLHCLGLSGDNMADWINDMHEAAKTLARECGASSLVSGGREGWAKVFPNARRLWTIFEESI